MRKTLILIFIMVIIIGICPLSDVYANGVTEQELDNSVNNVLGGIDFSKLDEYLSNLEENSLLNNGFLSKIKQILSGKFDSAETFLQYISQLFLGQFTKCLPTLVSILAIGILCGLFSKNRGSLLSHSTNEIIYLVCFSLIIVEVLIVCYKLVSTSIATLQSIKLVTNLSMPIILTLMIASGTVCTAQVYQPAIAMFSGGIIEIVVGIIMPLISVSLVFSVISNLSNNVKVDKLSSVIKNASIWILGTVFTIFTAFLTVQGLTATSIDGISLKAAKFATKNYIPILGGYLSDGFDIIVASTVLIKNSLGVVSLILLLLTIISPILEIMVYSLGLQVVTAVIEPVTDERIVKFMSAVSQNLTILVVAIIAVAFMFLVLIMLSLFTAGAI